jgi:hypothetical protein
MLGRILLLLGLPLLATPALALTIYKYTDANGVVTYSDQAAPGAQVFVFSDRMVEKLDTQVKLETRKHAAGETLLVRNDLFAPVDIELKLDNVENAVGARPSRSAGYYRRAARFAWPPWPRAMPASRSGTRPSFAMLWAIRACYPSPTSIRCPGAAVRSA